MKVISERYVTEGAELCPKWNIIMKILMLSDNDPAGTGIMFMYRKNKVFFKSAIYGNNSQ